MSWLWKSDSSSTASFEKALSKLSTQITSATVSLEITRSRGRRIQALWTLYTTALYLVFLLILVLVIGPQDWTVPHSAGIVGAPATIYGIRLLISSLFGWRAGRQQAHLTSLQKQRETKIADLKKATKYDSTQELLQKYGGVSSREALAKQNPQDTKEKPKKPSLPVQRTGMAPPPTANIPDRQTQQSPITPVRPDSRGSISSRSPQLNSPVPVEEPGFAPNAFTASGPTRASYEQSPHWYDRILDVMLGEDEQLAKNRIVLLCQNCRMVNGQAPPGVKTLEQLGKWRCGSCGAWNGIESEGAKMVREMTEQLKVTVPDDWEPVSKGEASEETTLFSSDIVADDTGKSTGNFQDEDSSVTKRVTRSSGKEPVEGLD